MGHLLFRIVIASLLTIPVAGARTARAQQQQQLLDGVAAQVGDKVVLYSEILQLSAPTERQLHAQGAPDSELARVRKQVLERLIERRLIETVIDRNELQASDAEVDNAIQGIAQENKLSLEQLRKSVEAEGLSFDTYREQIRDEIERAQAINGRVRSRVTVSEAEVRSLYDQRYKNQPPPGDKVRLEQILVPTGPDRSGEDALAAIKQAQKRVHEGASLASCAKEVPGARFTDLDWLHTDQLADWMRDAIKATPPGEFTAPILTDFGCAMLRVVDRKHFEPLTYEQAKDQLYQEVYNQKMERVYREWIEDLRKQIFVDRKDLTAAVKTLQEENP